MAYPWDQMLKEPTRAHRWLTMYLQAGCRRSLAALAAVPAAPDRRTLEKWSSRWEWSARAHAYDAHLAEQDRQQWESYRAQARAALYARRALAVEVLEQIASGAIPIPDCTCGAGKDRPEECRCGAFVPVLDRHGERVGLRPAVAAAPRLEAAKAILDRIGIVAPKRVELSGPDAQPLKVALQTHLGALPVAALEALVAAFPDTPDDEDAG